MKKSLVNGLKGLVGFAGQALSGTTNITGEIIDTQGYHSAAIFLMTDGIAASSLDAQLEIQHGDEDDLSDADAVEDADLVGTEASTAIAETDDKVVKSIGYIGNKRYIRPDLVVTANNGTDVVSCLVVLGHALAEPVDQNS